MTFPNLLWAAGEAFRLSIIPSLLVIVLILAAAAGA